MSALPFILLAYVFCVGWALIDSEWQEFKEDEDKDELSDEDNWGAQ